MTGERRPDALRSHDEKARTSRLRHLVDRLLFPREVRDRLSALRCHFDVRRQLKELEESCIPSYLHSNPLAAWVSWSRLVVAARAYERWAPPGAVLDFGAATGEIAHLIRPSGQYCFIEQLPAV